MKNKPKSTQKPKPHDEPGPSKVPTAAVEDKIWKDPRFEHLVSDPRFRGIHKATQKIKIDKRFESMFNDDKFKVKYTVDKYGRPVNKSSSEDLKKYYDLSGSENDDEEQVKEAAAIAKDDNDKASIGVELDSDDAEIPATLKAKLQDLQVDYARGERTLLSDDSSDDESSDDGKEDELFIEHVWGELDVDAPRTDESTRRLAVCNMDWDRIRAADIMVLCHSFLPPAGVIWSVTIYPSEYGKARMADEELKGPQELTERKLNSSDNDDDSEGDGDKAVVDETEEGAEYNMEKLRQYQLNRLKYYYGVIECNNVSTADKIYAECDGLEYESTATKLDLRFVPDEMTFDDEPKDVCTELPDTTKYMPRLFTTTALQQAKVELTWDENDLERKEMNDKLMSGKLNEVGDQELRKYVAYSSEEDEHEDETNVSALLKKDKNQNSKAVLGSDDEDDTDLKSAKKDPIAKYKALLADINQKEADSKNNRIEMEFSWGIGATNKKSVDVDAGKTKKSNPEQTHFDKILQLKKEKKKARKVEQKRLRRKFRKGADPNASSADDGSSSDDDDLPDGVDLNDPYFAEEFENGDFEAPKKIKKQKHNTKKRHDDQLDDEQQQAELALLLDDGDVGGVRRSHFSLKKIQDTENESKTKRRKKSVLRRSKKQNDADKALLVEDDFRINTDDNRFAAVYSSHLYNIDPTNSNFKKTKGMEAIIGEKLKRRPVDAGLEGVDDPSAAASSKKTKRNVETSMLVKSIKRKVAQH